MLERQREGIAKAKAGGKYKGRPVSIDAAEIKRLSDELGPAAIAKRLGIARGSVYRVLGAASLRRRGACGSARDRRNAKATLLRSNRPVREIRNGRAYPGHPCWFVGRRQSEFGRRARQQVPFPALFLPVHQDVEIGGALLAIRDGFALTQPMKAHDRDIADHANRGILPF